ncbi:hypothetical protein K7X08_032477 [Anisodus acutangulus]|uniref:Uncharacterized protein n=1 Tax=Anisodus acutangulus TaxID=402998 RepID=A0A9Q1R6G5_9SOLA|nr:hypothetical protein K7X08_032477 [Anisodus acutangulus]
MQQQNQETEGINSGHASRPYKRPRMVRVGILVVDDGFTTLNPGMPSSRVTATGRRAPMRSDVVTEDIGYTPRQEFKWRGKSIITSIRFGLKLLLTIRANAVHLESHGDSCCSVVFLVFVWCYCCCYFEETDVILLLVFCVAASNLLLIFCCCC